MKNDNKTFSMEELCTLVKMNKRKVRFYMQKGLVHRPHGTGKGSYYTLRHLEQLLAVRKWKDAGLSLVRIQEIINDEESGDGSEELHIPLRPRKAGSLEVWSHINIDDAVELHIEPSRSGLSSEQVRKLCRMIIEQFKKIKRMETAD